eukprot:7485744-Alexandrium_andersonii.AAC.1
MADNHCAFGSSTASVMRHHPSQIPLCDRTALRAVGVPLSAQLGGRNVAQDLGPSCDGRRRPF